jgi:predicted Zn-dependent peptidase
MLNRTIAPETKLTESINIPKAQQISLSNGTSLLSINEGDVDVCRIDIIFDAGSRYQNQKLQASASLSMLTEGTTKFSSQQISEHFDYLGSFVSAGADKDFARLTAYTLNRNLDKTLEMLEEILKNPSYPQAELDIWSKRGNQNLTVEMEKTSTLSRIEFFKTIYGEDHPYGTYALPHDFEALNQTDLHKFHSMNLGSLNAKIVLSGKITDKQISLVNKHVGSESWGNNSPRNIEEISSIKTINSQKFILKPDAVQSAIKVGRELFTRTHPDFCDMTVLNTILGGYFGSRLMKNIREDKGFTYGIGSYIVSLRDSGYLIISTEVGADYTKQTLKEIMNEIDRLKVEPISIDELSLVRSYLMGDVLRSFNGPFAVADNTIGLLNFNNLDYSFYDRFIHSIKTITPERIIELANKWLDKNSLVECVAGSNNPF